MRKGIEQWRPYGIFSGLDTSDISMPLYSSSFSLYSLSFPLSLSYFPSSLIMPITLLLCAIFFAFYYL